MVPVTNIANSHKNREKSPPVTNILAPARGKKDIIMNKFGLYHKLVYICTVVETDCAAALDRRNKLND